jgi:hypothetical protein
MRRWVVLLAVAACARGPVHETAFAVEGSPRPGRAPPGLLPAGACGYDPYLGDACSDAPRFAVVARRVSDAATAESALAAAPHLAGYPFAASFDEIAAADARRRGVMVVVGLFAARRDADAWASALHDDVVPLASVEELNRRRYDDVKDWDRHEASIVRVVETTAPTAAFAGSDLERVESELDERLARNWTKLPGQQLRRVRALASLSPRCTLDAGRVFVTDEATLYRFLRHYAPVTCPDGRRAWVPWRATRLESAVVRAGDQLDVHQVILVECDVPTLETRPLGPAPDALGALTDEHCGD